MRPWIVALVLTTSLAGSALAGGIHGRIEGPAADRVTYTARMQSCNPGDTFEPWAIAEGLVDGKRRSVLLRLEPTAEHGVYTFTRKWPKQGRWMIRLSLGHPPAPATVATLRADGTVLRNEQFFKSDGSRECSRTLRPRRPAAATRNAKGSGDDDC